jgi:APA family basic amino acid/polyamine antiporter
LIVCTAVLIMRRTNPQAERPFRAPFYPVLPILGILCCLLLMFSLPVENWYRLIIWMLMGFVLYFAYGYSHSELRKRHEAEAAGIRR